jgi:triosephosphate isomerase
MRKKLIAGNWKMHMTMHESVAIMEAIVANLPDNADQLDFWIAPPALYIEKLNGEFGHSGIAFGAQDLSHHDQGAYTGELAGSMIRSCGGHFTLVGHSERRQYHQEDDVLIHQKILAGLRHQLQVVYCCGEHLEQREAGKHYEVIAMQLHEALIALSAEAVQHITIAYEPVWAIGTGVHATAEQAGDMHRFIRSELTEMFGEAAAHQIRILYGGSVKPNNAAELFQDPDIDGALIGGASLKADDLLSILSAAL